MLSIESQRQELKRYAERERLEIVALKEEAKSAKTPGRTVFNEILTGISRGEADGILAWHPDRLARNALDGGQIIHLLDTGKLVSLKFPTYTFENTSQGKFMLAIMFGQSKYYVDSLSENVRRGNRTKREKGWYPGVAPMGYLNARSESGEKIIIPDPERFPILKKLWILLLSGGFSVPQLLELATNQMGLRTLKRKRSGGKPVSTSGMYHMFSNPFYAGEIVHENQWYRGRHEPMVTLAEFERAQELLGKRCRARPKTHIFAYTGLIRCGFCGGSITAERKTNRYGTHYVYYHCTHKKTRLLCREKCVEEGGLEKQIVDFLKGICLDEQQIVNLLNLLEKERTNEQEGNDGIRRSIEQALEACRRHLDNLTKLRYRELINDTEFTRQRGELNLEGKKLSARLVELNTERWIESSRNLFFFSNRAVFWFTHGSIAEKRLILSTVGSNLSLTAKKLSIDATKPFQVLQKSRHLSTWQAVVKDVRTLFREEPHYSIPLLPEIPRTES